MHKRLRKPTSAPPAPVTAVQSEEAKVQQLDSRVRALGARIADGFDYSLRKLLLLRNLVKFVVNCGIETLTRRNSRTSSVYPPAQNPKEVLGVNVAGYFESEKGVGEAARATLRSLDAAAIPYAIKNIFDISSLGVQNADYRFSRENPYGFNLIHVNADLISRFARKNARFLAGRYNIGYWNWELSSLPPEWIDRFRCLNEVWAPSTFCLEAISGMSPIPVVRVPYSVDPNLKANDNGMRMYLGLRPGTFVYLFYFDFHSYMERKNPIGLIKAFRKAFSAKEDAVLVIKCLHAKRFSRALLEHASEGAQNIKIYDAMLTREDLHSLLASCDAYVSLHRSEGFGLTLTEAMNFGKPVIATGYSGNVDFMNENDSFLVKYRLAEIEKDYGPYKKGFVWAEPDIDHAAELMRYVCANRDQAKAVGERARQDIRRLLHPNVLGGTIRERLAKVSQSEPR